MYELYIYIQTKLLLHNIISKVVYQKAFIIFAEKVKKKNDENHNLHLTYFWVVEKPLSPNCMAYPSFVHLSASDICLDKCVPKKMVIRIYYLMDYDKLRPRLRSSWVARCLWQQIASICENTQNVSNINVLYRIHHRNA